MPKPTPKALPKAQPKPLPKAEPIAKPNPKAKPQQFWLNALVGGAGSAMDWNPWPWEFAMQRCGMRRCGPVRHEAAPF